MNENTFYKDPSAVLDYVWDWTAWLMVGESIDASEISVSAGIACDRSTHDGAKVTAWISGGENGKGYWATCHVVTNQGRADDRTIYLVCRER